MGELQGRLSKRKASSSARQNSAGGSSRPTLPPKPSGLALRKVAPGTGPKPVEKQDHAADMLAQFKAKAASRKGKK